MGCVAPGVSFLPFLLGFGRSGDTPPGEGGSSHFPKVGGRSHSGPSRRRSPFWATSSTWAGPVGPRSASGGPGGRLESAGSGLSRRNGVRG